MPRGKKKATVAEAPPSTPPQAKKRKTASSTPKGTVKAGSVETVTSTTTAKPSSRNLKT